MENVEFLKGLLFLQNKKTKSDNPLHSKVYKSIPIDKSKTEHVIKGRKYINDTDKKHKSFNHLTPELYKKPERKLKTAK